MTSTTMTRAGARLVGILAALALSLGLGLVASTPAQAASKTVWDKVASCESTGRWKINTHNGYYGGLQFSAGTWKAFGGRKYAKQAHRATKGEQIAIARRVLAAQGPRAWPVCSARAGLTKKNGKASKHATPSTNPGVKAAAKKAAKPVAKKAAKPTAKKASKSTVAKATAAKKTAKVRRGDTLAVIAKRYHVKGGWKGLWKLNKKSLKNPHRIHVGQKLKVA